jgi:methionyl-tRNA synthetase
LQPTANDGEYAITLMIDSGYHEFKFRRYFEGNFSYEGFLTRVNSDLANDLGNLAQRSLSLIAKNCDGRIPEPGDFTEADRVILAAADALYASARAAMDRQGVKPWLDAVWSVVADANRYFAAEEPWAKRKTDFKRMETILYVTAEVVRQVAILVQPAMPTAAAKLLDLLAEADDARTFRALGPAGRLVAGRAVPAPTGVFPRYVDPEADQADVEAAKPAKSSKPPKAPKPPKGEGAA